MTDREHAISELEAEGLDVTEWHDEANTVYDEHAHPQREVRIVLDGHITIHTNGNDRELGPGDRLDLAPMQPHSATVGPEGVHYIAGTDRTTGR